jgi:predicted transcriptional regulator
MRIVIDVPAQTIASLDWISVTEQRSRATLIREAIADFLQRKSVPRAEAAFGLWSRRKKEGVRFQEEVRGEWQKQ